VLRKNSPPALPCPGHRSTDTREAIHGCLGVCAPKIVFCEEGAVTEVTHGGFRLGAGIAFHGRWDSPNGASLAIAIGTVPMASPTLARLQVAYEPHEGAANLFSVTPRYRVLCVSLQSSLAGRYAISLQMHDQWSSPTWLQCPAPGCRWDSPNAGEASATAWSLQVGSEPLGQSQWLVSHTWLQCPAPGCRWDSPNAGEASATAWSLQVGSEPLGQSQWLVSPTWLQCPAPGCRWDSPNGGEASATSQGDKARAEPLGQSQWLVGASLHQAPAPHCRWDSPNATETSTAAQSNKAGAEPLGQSQWQAAAKDMRMMRHRSDASCALPSPLTVGTVPTVAGVFEQHGRMKDLAERERSRLIDSDRASTTHLPLGQSQWLAGISMIHGIKAFNRRAVGAAFRVAALHVPRTASCWGRPYHQRGNQMKPDPQ